jgi:hypothetical protein
MRKFICQNTFTSPHTGRTYIQGDEIDLYEYQRLSYSDTHRFNLKPNESSFAYKANNNE